MKKDENPEGEFGTRQGERNFKEDKAGQTFIPVDPQQIENAKSQKRMMVLTKNIFEAINKTTEEVEGEFTIYEMIDVLLRIPHSYNKRFLDQQHKKENPNEKG